MKKIERITCVINNISSTGGAERVITVLCNKFVEKGISVTIIVRQDTKSSYPLDERVNVVSTSVKDTPNKIIRNLKRNIKLRKEIIKSKPDIIISFMTAMNIQVLLFTFGLNIPIVISERNNPSTDISKRDMPLVRLLYRKAAGYVFQTEDAQKWFPSKISSVGTVIANPISENLPPRIKKTDGKIVNVGRLSKQKNQKLLIDAFKDFRESHPNYKLFIYGDGPEEESLKAYIYSFHLDNEVLFMGYVSNVMEQIADAELFILSSDYEGMPNALIEAMGIGIPCISTDCPCGGPRYLINNNENGILVSVGDKDQLLAAMKKMTEDEQFAENIGKNAKNINDKLNANTIADKWLEYCMHVLEKRRS